MCEQIMHETKCGIAQNALKYGDTCEWNPKWNPKWNPQQVLTMVLTNLTLIHTLIPSPSPPRYDNKAKHYDTYRTPSPGIKTLEPHLTFPSGSAICDLGCGTGVFIPKLLESKPSACEANDPSEGMVKQTEER